MRLFRASVAAALVAVLIGAFPLVAESAGWVSGHALDAGGRPLAGQRVELVGALQGQPVGVPVQANVTDARGAWSFSDVPAGEYVVRMVHRGRTAGVPVSVTGESGAPGVLIVAPSVPASAPGWSSQDEEDEGSTVALVTSDALMATGLGILGVAAVYTVVEVLRDES
ncbi:MAG: carboxypeptidase-like regulatory domain-containing protein [Acidobacteria bacterium]|nr:carboxypeptidase-like regulatory domain-containing protein [Acidobacteriota bacterium]